MNSKGMIHKRRRLCWIPGFLFKLFQYRLDVWPRLNSIGCRKMAAINPLLPSQRAEVEFILFHPNSGTFSQFTPHHPSLKQSYYSFQNYCRSPYIQASRNKAPNRMLEPFLFSLLYIFGKSGVNPGSGYLRNVRQTAVNALLCLTTSNIALFFHLLLCSDFYDISFAILLQCTKVQPKLIKLSLPGCTGLITVNCTI